MGDSVLDSVKGYYGKELQGTKDLKVAACTTLTGLARSQAVRDAINDVHIEVKNRYYGCGLVIPQKLEGMTVLDLGCGSGQDCFALSKLVGPKGHVTGLDMTDEQLDVANKYIQYHTEKFGFSTPNVNFVKGFIEKLTASGIQENSIDIIVSNCVINLSPDKAAVIAEAYKVLKVGGELYFSDIYADRDLPESARKHEVLWGECVSGALCWKELYNLARTAGFSSPRLVTAAPVPIDREDFQQILGDARFVSVTYRLFKLPCEHHAARQVIYSGEISGCDDSFQLDHRNTFKTGDVCCVDSELATILLSSRFKDEFEFQPVSKTPSSGPGSCCQSQEVDPFVYLEQKAATGCNVPSSCCGPSTKCC